MTGSGPSLSYDVFISYRREGGAATALFLREKLMHCGLRVFLDVTDLRKGYFDETLLQRIRETPNFLVILSPKSLERCESGEDWLRKEIAQAIQSERNIIPLLMESFQFPTLLPDEIKALPRHQGVMYSHTYHEAMVGMILQSIEAEREERRRKAEEEAAKAAALAGVAPPEPPKPAPVPQAKAADETQPRMLDAAMAREIPVGKPAELTVMIRRVESGGLKAVLEIEESDAKPEDVRSKAFELEFPVDAQGRVGAAEVVLQVSAPEFEPPTQRKKLRVPPKADSETYSFLLTPRNMGELMVILELFKDEVCMASRVLRTNGATGDRAASDAKVLVTMPMTARGVGSEAPRATPVPPVMESRPPAAATPARPASKARPPMAATPLPREAAPRPEAPRATPAPRMEPPMVGGVREDSGMYERAQSAAAPPRPPREMVTASSGRSGGWGRNTGSDTGATLAEMIGAEKGNFEGRKLLAFVVGWIVALEAIRVLGILAYHLGPDPGEKWLITGLLTAGFEAAVIWGIARMVKRLWLAGLLAGLACMGIVTVLTLVAEGLYGPTVFPNLMPEFIDIAMFVWFLGIGLKKIESKWLAIAAGTAMGLLGGSIANAFLRLAMGQSGFTDRTPMRWMFLVVSSLVFATVYVWIARGKRAAAKRG